MITIDFRLATSDAVCGKSHGRDPFRCLLILTLHSTCARVAGSKDCLRMKWTWLPLPAYLGGLDGKVPI